MTIFGTGAPISSRALAIAAPGSPLGSGEGRIGSPLTVRRVELEFDCFPATRRLNEAGTNFSREGGLLVRCLLPRIGVSRTIASRGAGGLATAGLVLLAAAGPRAFAAEDNNAAME